MFNCQNCGECTKTKQPVNKIIVSKRLRKYEKEIKRGPERGTIEIIEGWEIVKELSACPKCYQELTGLKPRLVEAVQRPVPLPEEPKREKRNLNKIRVDKNDPQWRKKVELEEVRRRESRSDDPRRIEKKQPIVEIVNRLSNAARTPRSQVNTNSRSFSKGRL